MINKSFLLLFLSLAALIVRCTVTPLAGGSDNPDFIVIGAIIDSNGHPAQGAVVTIAPASFNPVSDAAPIAAMSDTTDASGGYRLAVSQKGAYTVQAVHLRQRTRLLITGVSVATDTTHLSKAALVPTGAVKIDLPSEGINPETGYLYVPGTDLHAFLNNRIDTMALDSLPAGTLPSIAYAETDVPGSIVMRYNVPVAPGETSEVSNLPWKYCRRLLLNTTAAGANVTGDMVNFPMLVRLNSDNFDFSQAQPGGVDIRFANRNNASLDYEIERWDAVNRMAEIWVKVDTIHGNDSTQTIDLYWGNANAPKSSDGTKVFDTAGGFQGVWHLAEPGNTTAFDATVNHYNGTPSGMGVSSAVPGIIGAAQEFDGATSSIEMLNTSSGKLNFPQDGSYTVSAWVYSDTVDGNWRLIVGKGHEQYYLKQQIKSTYGNWEFVEYHDKSTYQITETPVTVKTWKYLTGVRQGNRQYLYLDGQPVDSTVRVAYDSVSRNTNADVTLGRYQNSVAYANEGYCFFDGKIDEVRISSAVRSADWIRLCYMNQRGDDRLTRFK
jgi:hypothetical protein